jgi:hypothetical protein
MGMQLQRGQSGSLVISIVDSLYGVHMLQAWESQQAETRKTKMGMENVNHISRPVSNTAHLRILLRLVDRAENVDKSHT